MSFWKSVPGALVLVLAIALTAATAGVVVQVHRATHPTRQTDSVEDLTSLLVRVEPVSFRAPDGVRLSGWLLVSRPGSPAVVLCHDLGSSKGSLISLAIALQERGLTVLLLDFRGHGDSDGSGSTLGILEKRDVIGAVDFLAGIPGVDARRIGVYGVGQGAHAAVLASADRPSLRVLVLDGLYPDARYPLVRRTYAGWRFGVRNLTLPPALTFDVLHGVRIGRARAADVLPRLRGCEVLLIAPAADVTLTSEMQAMYESIPYGADTEGNLVVLPATQASGFAGEGMERYLERVCSFFEGRLVRS